MFNLCLLAPNFDGADLSAWRVSGYGGAIMPEVTLERIAEKLPRLKLINCYGSTETTSPAVFMPPEEAVARKEYVGLTVPCGHITVMDFDGVEVPHGTPGEVYIGGAMVVPGYFNNPEATEREFKAGYWKSGDLGIMDEKGYLRIIDRIKDVINRGGFKIFASEVENILARSSRDHRGRGGRQALSGARRTGPRLRRPASRRRRRRADALLRRRACPTIRSRRPSIGSTTRCRATPTARCSSAICARALSPELRNYNHWNWRNQRPWLQRRL